MPHAFRVGQLVALAQTSRDLETHEVVQRRRSLTVPRFPPLEGFGCQPCRRVRSVAHRPASETLHNTGSRGLSGSLPVPSLDAGRVKLRFFAINSTAAAAPNSARPIHESPS